MIVWIMMVVLASGVSQDPVEVCVDVRVPHAQHVAMSNGTEVIPMEHRTTSLWCAFVAAPFLLHGFDVDGTPVALFSGTEWENDTLRYTIEYSMQWTIISVDNDGKQMAAWSVVDTPPDAGIYPTTEAGAAKPTNDGYWAVVLGSVILITLALTILLRARRL